MGTKKRKVLPLANRMNTPREFRVVLSCSYLKSKGLSGLAAGKA